MTRMAGVLLFISLFGSVTATDLSVARQALRLELSGRLNEALEQYHVVLLSRDFSAENTADSKALRAFLLAKMAWISISLGEVEEAWDLGGQLVSLGTAEAVTSGKLIRLRLQGKESSPPWAPPAAAANLSDPGQLLRSLPGRYWRIQVGAFKVWTHTRTLLDMLLEKGWSPYVEDRFSTKDRLQAIFVVSHDLAKDLKNLKEQGFEPSASAVNP